MSRLLVLVLLVVLIVGLAVSFCAGLVRRRKIQFKLRTLLAGIALVAVLLSAILSWGYWTTAKTTWLKPSSPEAASMVPTPVIEQTDKGYQATFRPRCRPLGELMNILESARLPSETSSGYRSETMTQEVTLEGDSRKPLEARLALLASNDVLQPGWFVIRGRVEDSLGRPVANAIVDLMGSYVYINHFATRYDGTFLMPVKAPAGWGYYLRIRYDHGKRRRQMDSYYFTLDPANREKLVIVRVR